MRLLAFDHVNVRTANLAAMVDWYDRVLGMKPGKRPNFDFPGAWLYLGDQALVHLVRVGTIQLPLLAFERDAVALDVSQVCSGGSQTAALERGEPCLDDHPPAARLPHLRFQERACRIAPSYAASGER